eukprot:SAG11_NODE_191_length_12943_cov_3.853706_5_plen_41_part_00
MNLLDDQVRWWKSDEKVPKVRAQSRPPTPRPLTVPPPLGT